MKKEKITWLSPPAGRLPVTEAQLLALGITPDNIKEGEARGNHVTRGPWNITVSYTALVLENWYDDDAGYTKVSKTVEYGIRKMSRCKDGGYNLFGRVSVEGQTRRAFTSSNLFELEDGRLIDVATINLCMIDRKKGE